MTLAEMYMNGMVKEAAGMREGFNKAKAYAADKANQGVNAAKSEFATQKDVVRNLAGKGDWDEKGVGYLRRAAGLGAAGTAVVGGGALALRKMMAKKSLGARLGGAFKKNRKAIAIGAGAGAAGLAGLAAYKKRQGK